MSATVEQRIESLKRFSPSVIAVVLDEESRVEYQLTFYPTLNAFKSHRSDEPTLPAGLRLPVLTVSYIDFVNGRIKLNPTNRMDAIILALKREWDDLSKEEKEEFFDNIPLNSLYLGVNPPTY